VAVVCCCRKATATCGAQRIASPVATGTPFGQVQQNAGEALQFTTTLLRVK